LELSNTACQQKDFVLYPRKIAMVSVAGNTKMLELSLRRIGKRFFLYTRKEA
jgi:hypothetical protein